MAREMGFDNINMDLIMGLPQEGMDEVRRTLDEIRAMKPDSLTVHSLAIKRAARLNMFKEDYEGLTIQNTPEMIDLSAACARELGMEPYYLYRQKYMSGSLENVGWCRKGQESIYNIIMMEELQTVVSVGGGGVTKLVDRQAGKILRLPNPKYPHDYLSSLDKVLAQKQELASLSR